MTLKLWSYYKFEFSQILHCLHADTIHKFHLDYSLDNKHFTLYTNITKRCYIWNILEH